MNGIDAVKQSLAKCGIAYKSVSNAVTIECVTSHDAQLIYRALSGLNDISTVYLINDKTLVMSLRDP